jgi:predicted DNA-binding transcriptional regulator YafY
LLADPTGAAAPPPSSKVATEIERYNPGLGPDEVDLLADAIENARAVQIGYVDRNGSPTVRAVTPMLHVGSWMQAWCHLRNAEREFLIGSIESVAPLP